MCESRLHISKWNELIQQIIEAGLIQKWSRDERIKYMKESGSVFRPLGVQHFYGGLLICLIFFLAAIMAFIAEHIIHRQLRHTPNNRHWRTADWIIDGQRHLFKLNPSGNRNKTLKLPIRSRSRVFQTHIRQPLPTTRRFLY